MIYKDMLKKPIKLGDSVEAVVLAGRYGQTIKYHGVVTKMPDQFGDLKLDGEFKVGNGIFNNGIAYNEHDDYEHGHITYIKIIPNQLLDPKLAVPKAYRPRFRLNTVDPSNNSNIEENFTMLRSEFDAMVEERHGAVYHGWSDRSKLPKDRSNLLSLEVHQSEKGGSGYLYDLYPIKNIQ